MRKGPNYSEQLYNSSAETVEQLEKNIGRYSFSPLANFLLLNHYKNTSDFRFDSLAKKTALQFGSAHWLEFQLFEKNSDPVSTHRQEKEHVDQEQKIEPPAVNYPEEIIEHQNPPLEIMEVMETRETVYDTPGENIPEIKPEETIPILHNINGDETLANPENTTAIIPGFDSVKEFNADDNDLEENAEIAFEPLHTVDYFASQGIKINDELITNDKLGSQMKSFTAWLKSMKKLHPGRLAEQNIATEKLVQISAEESNVNTEVLTEAMAEVLIKQDKKEKAIEMFTKLSLINPSKSAYFAAKIESIKSS